MTKPFPETFLTKPGLSPGNRSLTRGVQILKAFSPGCEFLSNSELSERTGLPRPTVSRLVQTLVGTGLLEEDVRRRGYRLAPSVFALAHSMWMSSTLLNVATPYMTSWSDAHQLNVGIATADGADMIYLDSIRYHQQISHRRVVRGQSIPMPVTSLGQAYLSAISVEQRDRLIRYFEQRWTDRWPAMREALEQATASVHQSGFCYASWLPGVVAVATPLVVDGRVYALNCSTSEESVTDVLVQSMWKALQELHSNLMMGLNSRIGEA